MGRQLHLDHPNGESLVVDLVDDESVSVRVDCGPEALWKNEMPLMRLTVDGLRWRNEEHHHLGWLEKALSVGDTITVRLTDTDEQPSALSKEELFVMPEKDCAFCGKKASKVDVLFEKDVMARICNECVASCQQELDERKSD